jgi:tetratricopeptide (TPR) repeat protein
VRFVRGKAAYRWLTLILVIALGAGGVFWWRHQAREAERALLARAEAALGERRHAAARSLFDEYLVLQPDDARARLLAARTARRLRELSEAVQHLERAGALGADAEAVRVEYELLALAQGDESVVPALRERAREEDEVALTILEALIQLDLDAYRLRLAQSELTDYLRRRPGDLHALIARGHVWESFLNFSDAVEDYRQAVAAHPDSEAARLKLGAALYIVGTPQEALEQYEWLAERHPERPDVRLGLAKGWRLTGALQRAEQGLDALLAEHPGQGEALWERGQLELDQGRAVQAEPYLRRAVQAVPFDRRFHYSLSRCLAAQKRTKEAEAVSAKVAEIDADLRRLEQIRTEVMQRPADAKLRCEGGLIFLRHGERREAARWLALALRLDPACAAARAALQEIDVPAGRPD